MFIYEHFVSFSVEFGMVGGHFGKTDFAKSLQHEMLQVASKTQRQFSDSPILAVFRKNNFSQIRKSRKLRGFGGSF